MWADFLGGAGPEFYGFNRITVMLIFATIIGGIILRGIDDGLFLKPIEKTLEI